MKAEDQRVEQGGGRFCNENSSRGRKRGSQNKFHGKKRELRRQRSNCFQGRKIQAGGGKEKTLRRRLNHSRCELRCERDRANGRIARGNGDHDNTQLSSRARSKKGEEEVEKGD